MSVEVELVSVCEGKVVGHLGILLNQNPRRKHVGSFESALPNTRMKRPGAYVLRVRPKGRRWSVRRPAHDYVQPPLPRRAGRLQLMRQTVIRRHVVLMECRWVY